MIGAGDPVVGKRAGKFRNVRPGAAVNTVIPLPAYEDIVPVPAFYLIIIQAAVEDIVSRAPEQKVLAAMPADEIIPRPAIHEIIPVFAGERVVGRPADDDVIARAAPDKHRAAAPADQDVIAAPTLGDLDFSLREVEHYARIAHHLCNVHPIAGMDVGLQVLTVNQQHVIAGPGGEGVTPRPARQPVVGGIADQRVVALCAEGVPDAFDRGIHDFACGALRHVARDPALGVHPGSVAGGREGVAVRIRQEVGSQGLFGLPALHERPAREHFIAVPHVAGLRCVGKIDLRDAELGKGLELAGIGLAVAIRIHPHAERGKEGIRAIEFAVAVGVQAF